MTSRIIRWLLASGVLLACLAVSAGIQAQTDDQVLLEVQALLVSPNAPDKTVAIERLAQADHPRALEIYALLLDSKLYFNRADDFLYVIDNVVEGAPALALLSQETSLIERRRDYRRVAINNAQRTQIRRVMAQTGLNHERMEVRVGAVQQLMGDLDQDALTLIREAYVSETHGRVRDLMAVALAIDTLTSGDEAAQRDAISVLGGSLEPRGRVALVRYVEATDQPRLKILAEQALVGIDQQVRFYKGLETVFFGLSMGSVLVLAAIGLAITFGVMGVINMAHGELIMIGAYTTFVIQQLMPNHIGLSVLVAVPAAFIVSGLVGIAIERGVIRFLYGRPLETLLATFGVSLVLQQAVRSIFSPLNRSVQTPEWMSGMLHFNPVFAVTWNRLYIILFCLMVFFLLLLILKRTALGLQVRAVSQNRAMARAMGVRSERVDMMTFGLGSGVAGIAGVALSQLTNVGPNLGQAYIIDSFMVVVFGGVGNIWGTLVAGMTLGVANKLMEPWAGAVLAKILVLVFIILFIQKRPRGLFPQRGRAAEG